MLYSLAATLFFAASVMLASRVSARIGAGRAFVWRTWIAFVLLAVLAHGFGSGWSGPGAAWFFISGLVGFGLGDLALFAALPRLGPRLTLLMAQCLAAPIAAATEWAWLGTTISPAHALAASGILLGTALALKPRRKLGGRALIIGLLFGLAAAWGQGAGAVISRHAFELNAAAGIDVDGMTATYQRMAGGVLVAISAWGWLRRSTLPTPAASPGPPPEPARSRCLLLANSLSGPVLGVSCYQAALADTPSALVLAIVATSPLIVIPMAWKWEGDIPSSASLLGAALAVGCVITLLLV